MLNWSQVGFSAFLWGKLWEAQDIVSCVEELAKLGYKAVEFKENQFCPDRPLAEELQRAVRLAEAAGMLISNVVILRDAVCPKQRETGIPAVRACIEAAAEAGIARVNLVTGSVPPDLDFARSWANLLDAFGQYLETAERCRVVLVVEAVVGQICHDYYTILPLMQHFASDHLALTLDPSHYVLYRNDLQWAVTQLGKCIQHVHLKDAVGHPGVFGRDFLFPILGEGMIDWPAFLQTLDKIGYTDYLSVEFESFRYHEQVLARDPARAAALSMDSLRPLWEQYQKANPRRSHCLKG